MRYDNEGGSKRVEVEWKEKKLVMRREEKRMKRGSGRKKEAGASVGAKVRLVDVIGHSLRGMSHMNQEIGSTILLEFPSSLDHSAVNQA